jgi:glutamine amidotransferase
MIVIVNLGLGNLISLQRAFDKIGKKNMIINKPLKNNILPDLVVLPGVGSYNYAMSLMKKKNFYNWFKSLIKKKQKILGICLGMQLLCHSSEEKKVTRGLGIFDGKIIKIKKVITPNVGWFNIEKNSKDMKMDIKKNDKFYFTHSFMYSKLNKDCIGYIKNSKVMIPAIIKKENVIGVQFHPEKSKVQGLNLLKYIIEKEFKIEN